VLILEQAAAGEGAGAPPAPQIGDVVLYRRAAEEWARVSVAAVAVNVPPGEEPEVAVRMPDGTVRDTVLGRLRRVDGVQLAVMTEGHVAVEGRVARCPARAFGTVTAGAGCLVYRGRWYYEIQLGTPASYSQLGFAREGFFVEADSGEGVGDDAESWGYDGCRQKAWHRGGSAYGGGLPPWQAGDVVGCLLDLNEHQIRFSLNGRPLGVAFEGRGAGLPLRRRPAP
jgi:hypothetical protein